VTNGTVTDAEDKSNWLNILSKSKESRLVCIEAMRVHVGELIRTGGLTLVQTQQFFKDVRIMITNFEQANDPDFKLWLTNEVGSAYELDGFAQKTYYSTQLGADLLAIYNGAY
jgi:hypothetical protein